MWRFWAIDSRVIGCVTGSARPAKRAQRIVSTSAHFEAALGIAAPGNEIILEPSICSGGHFRAGLRQVVIRSAEPNDRAIFDGDGTITTPVGK